MNKYFIIIIILISCHNINDDKNNIKKYFNKNQIALTDIVNRIVNIYNISIDKKFVAQMFQDASIKQNSPTKNYDLKLNIEEIEVIKTKCKSMQMEIVLVSQNRIEITSKEIGTTVLIYLVNNNFNKNIDECIYDNFEEPCMFNIIDNWYGQIAPRPHGIS